METQIFPTFLQIFPIFSTSACQSIDSTGESYKYEIDLFQTVPSTLGILVVPSILPDSSTLKASFTCRCFGFAENISDTGHPLRVSPTKANHF